MRRPAWLAAEIGCRDWHAVRAALHLELNRSGWAGASRRSRSGSQRYWSGSQRYPARSDTRRQVKPGVLRQNLGALRFYREQLRADPPVRVMC